MKPIASKKILSGKFHQLIESYTFDRLPHSLIEYVLHFLIEFSSRRSLIFSAQFNIFIPSETTSRQRPSEGIP